MLADAEALVIVLDPTAPKEAHDAVLALARESSPEARYTRGDDWIMIALGQHHAAAPETFDGRPGVLRAVAVTAPFWLASRETFGRATTVSMSGNGRQVPIGAPTNVVMFVRLVVSPEGIVDLARAAHEAGADVLLAGAIPPGGTAPDAVIRSVREAARLGVPACVEGADTEEVEAAGRIASMIEG